MYQQHTSEQPSAELDTEVLNQARAHLSQKSMALNSESTAGISSVVESSPKQKSK